MTEIITKQLMNEVDKSEFRLYIEWMHSHFKVLLLRPSMVPLHGEMTDKEISYFSAELSKTNDEYLQETRAALTGKDVEVQFFLQDRTFHWKRKRMWTLGKIVIQPISDINILCATLQQLLELYENYQEQLVELENENVSLKESTTKLSSNIEEMIKIKNDMEMDLYKRFLLILNTKKEKIRELQSSSNNRNARNPVFDAPTDESDTSDEGTETQNKEINKPEKRKLGGANISENASPQKRQCPAVNATCQLDDSPKASTSKDADYEMKQLLSTSSNETESDFELKYVDTSPNTNCKSYLNVTEEEAEEELFSQ